VDALLDCTGLEIGCVATGLLLDDRSVTLEFRSRLSHRYCMVWRFLSVVWHLRRIDAWPQSYSAIDVLRCWELDICQRCRTADASVEEQTPSRPSRSSFLEGSTQNPVQEFVVQSTCDPERGTIAESELSGCEANGTKENASERRTSGLASDFAASVLEDCAVPWMEVR